MRPEQKVIQQLRLISIIKIISSIAILGILTYLYSRFQFTNKSLETILLWVVTAISIVAGVTDAFRFKKIMERIAEKTFEEKLTAYKTSSTIRNTVIISVSILFSISFFLTGLTFFQIEAMVGAFFLVYFYPSDLRLSKELKISISEIETYS